MFSDTITIYLNALLLYKIDGDMSTSETDKKCARDTFLD